MSRDVFRPGKPRAARWVGPLVALVLSTLLSGCCCCLGGWGWPPIGGDPLEEALQKYRDARHRTEIRRLEQLGGPEASRRLLEIYHASGASYRIPSEVIQALGRMGRTEDVPALLEISYWKVENNVPSYFPEVAQALGEIGSPEACAALCDFLRRRLKPAAYTFNWYESPAALRSVRALIDAIRRAECLSDPGLAQALWAHGGDLWTRESIQTVALEFLAGSGDPDAAGRLEHYDEASRVFAPPEEVRQIVQQRDLPWWLRVEKMETYVGSFAAKEDFLDTCFDLLANAYATNAPATSTRILRSRFLSWARKILYGEKSTWRGVPAAYFQNLETEYRQALEPGLFQRVAPWIRYFADLQTYQEERERRKAAGLLYKRGGPRSPESPQW